MSRVKANSSAPLGTVPTHTHAGKLLQGVKPNLTQRPSGDRLEQFVDLLAECDDILRSAIDPPEAFDKIFGERAARLLGFHKGYVAGINVKHQTFHITRIINPLAWERDGDQKAIEEWVGNKRPILTPEGRLVTMLTKERSSYLMKDYRRDANISPKLRGCINLESAIASPFVAFDKVLGYILMGYLKFPTPEIQWMHEHLVAHAALPAILSFWLDELLIESESATTWRLLGQQAGALMHDLKQPIGTLKVSLRTLEESNLDRISIQETIKTSQRQVVRLQDAIANVLSFVRHIDLRRRFIKVRDVLEKSLPVIFPDTDSLVIHGEGLHQRIYADEDKLVLALRNIIQNAFESTGRITTKRKARVEIFTDRRDDEIAISIIDNGPGIPQGKLSDIFKPSYSTKTEGTGFGLAVAERFVTAHGGRIVARNNENARGARFDVILPISTAQLTKRGNEDDGKNPSSR